MNRFCFVLQKKIVEILTKNARQRDAMLLWESFLRMMLISVIFYSCDAIRELKDSQNSKVLVGEMKNEIFMRMK